MLMMRITDGFCLAIVMPRIKKATWWKEISKTDPPNYILAKWAKYFLEVEPKLENAFLLLQSSHFLVLLILTQNMTS